MQVNAFVIKLYLFDSCHYHIIAMCIKQLIKLYQRLSLNKNVTDIIETFARMSPFLANICLWRFGQVTILHTVCVIQHMTGRLFE